MGEEKETHQHEFGERGDAYGQDFYFRTEDRDDSARHGSICTSKKDGMQDIRSMFQKKQMLL